MKHLLKSCWIRGYTFFILLASLGGGNLYADCTARDFSASEQTVLDAYIAFYGRPADAGGLAFWSGRLDSEGGNLDSIIDAFANSEEYDSRFGRLREILALDEFLHTPVRKVSLGQRMRADLAASLLHGPELLFLDEPTIGLDLIAKDAIRTFLVDINREFGTTILLTTHDLRDIEILAERVLVIDGGRLLFDGSIEDLRGTILRVKSD